MPRLKFKKCVCPPLKVSFPETRTDRVSIVVVVRRRLVVVVPVAVSVVAVDRRGGVVVVVRRVDLLDHGAEPVHVVGGVLDHAGGAVRFDQAVRALDRAPSVAHLVLALDVARVRVLDVVTEVVRGGRRRVTVTVVVVVVVVTVMVGCGLVRLVAVRDRHVSRRVGPGRWCRGQQGGGDDKQLKSKTE